MENYPRESLPNYIDTASPVDSPFGSPALQHIELEVFPATSSRGYVSYTLTKAPLAQEDVSAAENNSEVATRTMPPAASAQEDGIVGEDQNDTPARGIIPIVLEWEVSFQPSMRDFQPTKRESYSFMEATRAWMFDSFYEYYGDRDVATWNGVVNAEIQEPSYDETLELSHTITIRYEAEFEEVLTGEEFYRSKLMLVMALSGTGAEGLQRDYLPSAGPFQAPYVSNIAFHIKE